MLIAFGCMMMGWMLTSTLGRNGQDLFETDDMYDPATAGVLEDPTGFGIKPSAKQPGIIGDSEPEDDFGLAAELQQSKEPSVKGALSDLHHAVKDKLYTWNPYYVKPAVTSSEHAAANTTSNVKATKNATSNSPIYWRA